jgi:glutathione S-transferase
MASAHRLAWVLSGVRGGSSCTPAAAAETLTLWGRSSSSNTQKVLWVLHELGLPFHLVPASARLGGESEYLVGQHTAAPAFGVVDTPEYAALNPHKAVPTLRDHATGTTLWESHSICRYLAQQHGPQLYGHSAEGMGRASMWMDWVLHGSNFANCFGSANHHVRRQDLPVTRTCP